MQEEEQQNISEDDEEEQLSFYGSGSSEQEGERDTRMAEPEMNMAATSNDLVMKSLEEMKESMELMQATQNAIAQRLATMEKVVIGMDADTKWVREDLYVVHEIVEKLAEYVGELSRPGMELPWERPQSIPEISPWGTSWPDGSLAPDSERAGATIVNDYDSVDIGEAEPSHIDGAPETLTSILETQMFDMDEGLENNIAGWAEAREGLGGDGIRDGSPTQLSPIAKQTRPREPENVEADELPETQMTLEAPHGLTQMEGPSMWKDFKEACKDLPSTADLTDSDEVFWVQAKRGRGSNSNRGDVGRCGSRGQGSLNLNLSPDGDDGDEDMVGEGEYTTTSERGGATKGRGRGGGRGTGRGKRPPIVLPRYMNPVIPCTTYTYKLCTQFVVVVV